MSGRVRMTAVSAVVASMGLTGAVLLVTAPMTAPRANAAQAVMAEPTKIEPTDPTITDEPGAEPEEPDPTVTVTIIDTPAPTVTITRTAKPTTKPKAPKTPKVTVTRTPVMPPSTQSVPTTAPVIPPNPLPSTQPPVESLVPEPQVSLALVSPTPTPLPSETAEPSPSFEEPTPDSVPIEIRNASPEYNQLELSRKLAIPGVLLAVLVMLGVFIFEGRIRRMAHAAAIRKAGPRAAGRHRGDDFPGAYPMPGYPIYHGGTAYAPIISFVPVQGGYPVEGSPLPHGRQGHGPYDQAPYDQAPYGQGHGAQIPLAPAPSEPWPRRDDYEHLGHGPDATAAFPVAGARPPLPGEPMAGGFPVPGQPPTGGEKATLQGPLPAHGKPRRGLLGRFRRGSS
ncbi:hypothetical protein [Sphaerisporangium flaviroseum]|uniref:hypothetical protein n=1 Tax=Sphaerisporangium flaviroseum TaxID=509199 RepID=UPI0031EED12B